MSPRSSRLSGVAPNLRAELITEIEELERLEDPWRQLAHACASPCSLPGWLLAWWRHLAPVGALIRSVAVYDDERLIGLAPFFTADFGRIDYRLIGVGMTRRPTPLACTGTETEVARLFTEALANGQPRPDLIALEGIDATSIWPEAFAATWPGHFKPWRYVSSIHPAAVIAITEDGFDSWFADRSRSFRKQMRRAKRRAEEIGARILLARSEEEGERALRAFSRLHSARWTRRGGSSLSPEAYASVAEAAQTLVPRDEMRLWTLELNGQPIAIQVTLAAGGDVVCFNSGFDEAFSELSPMLLTILAVVEDAFVRGERRIDLGHGSEPYKLSFANTDAPVYWTGLVPRTRRYPLTRVRLAPAQARWRAARLTRRLSPQNRARLKRILRRT